MLRWNVLLLWYVWYLQADRTEDLQGTRASESEVRGFVHEDSGLSSIMWAGEISLYIIMKYSNRKYRTSRLLPKWHFAANFPPSFVSYEGLAWLPSLEADLGPGVFILAPVSWSLLLRGIPFSQLTDMLIRNNGPNCSTVNLY